MKKAKHGMWQGLALLVALLVGASSCREESEYVPSYGHDDLMTFAEAKASLEGQFKAIWTVMSTNYPTWDYEMEMGVDWDDVYKEYLPKFQALDVQYDRENPVPDEALVELYTEIFSRLHDGHMKLYLQNIHTKGRINSMISTKREGVESEEYHEPSPLLLFHFFHAGEFGEKDLSYFFGENEVVDYSFDESNRRYLYARLKDDILYYTCATFDISNNFDKRDEGGMYDEGCKVWEAWFNAVQELSDNGSLKGLVIDLRNNGGGDFRDFSRIIGALRQGDDERGVKIGYWRAKSGVGRLDYGPLFPMYGGVYSEPHVTVTAPIVILVDGHSASMSEMTTIAAKRMKNCHVIGTKTYGAFSPSISSPDGDTYSVTYGGNVGDPKLASALSGNSYFAPFYIYIPSMAYVAADGKVLEGSGLIPDEIVPIDRDFWLKNYADNQILYAIDYIRNQHK